MYPHAHLLIPRHTLDHWPPARVEWFQQWLAQGELVSQQLTPQGLVDFFLAHPDFVPLPHAAEYRLSAVLETDAQGQIRVVDQLDLLDGDTYRLIKRYPSAP